MQNEMRSEITDLFLVEMLFSCPVLGSCVIINKRFCFLLLFLVHGAGGGGGSSFFFFFFFFFRFNLLCVWILF